MRYFIAMMISVSFLISFEDFNKTDISLYNKTLKSTTYQNKPYFDSNATLNFNNQNSKENFKDSIFDNIEIHQFIEFKFTKDI